MDLSSDRISMDMDKSNVKAMGTPDSTAEGGIKGKPVFKKGSDTYDTDTIKFNFKSKKALINNVYTEQQDGFLTGMKSKRDSSGVIYLQHGRYTTCDDPHPDFYISLSRAKVRPGKDVVFGPAYLVVCDVPMPLAIPYGFFPFTKSYSSGFIMPTYGDETARGFYLRDGGYYFAMNDKWDLKLLGEIYTKDRGDSRQPATTERDTNTRVPSSSVTRIRRTATRECQTLPSRRASNCNGATVRTARQTHTVRFRQV